MISVIITAFKEPKTIGKAISAFLPQISKKDEILAACPDKETADVIKGYSKKFRQVKYIKDPGKGKPAALNLLFKKAKGDILVFTDGDVFAGSHSLKPLLQHFKNPKIGAVTGRTIAMDDRKKILGYWAHLLNDAAHLERKQRYLNSEFIFCSGYLFAMRRKIVKKIPEKTLDDAFISALVWKKGYSIAYEPDSTVYIKNPATFSDWVMQKRRNARGHAEINKLFKISMKSFKKEFSSGTLKALSYPKNLREFFYTVLLFPARLYIWILTFYDGLRGKNAFELWKRVESTK